MAKKKDAKKKPAGKKAAGKKAAGKKRAGKKSKETARKGAGKKAIKAKAAAKEARKAEKKRGRERHPERVTVICTYRVRADMEPEFHALMTRHWPTLRKLGLVTKDRPILYSGKDESGAPLLVEIFSWVDAQAPDRAHADPEVMAIWHGMEPYLEERSGHRQWEFVHVAPAAIRLAKL